MFAPSFVPAPDIFRAWLRRCLDDLQLRPATLSGHAGLSINSVSRILKGGDVTLGTALKIESALREIAQSIPTPLPPLQGGAQ